jgi:cytidyltransferase-like protein
MIMAGSLIRDRAATGARVVVATSLDDLRSSDVRFLQEAARLGNVHVRLSSDELIGSRTARPPSFHQSERLFLARSLRSVDSASVVRRPLAAALADGVSRRDTIAVPAAEHDPELAVRCRALGIDYRVIGAEELGGFPSFSDESLPVTGGVRRVVVSGCFDWLHSGHIRFFMDAAAYGDLHVVVGSDENVRLLKGPGHPLHRQDERRYMVEAVRSVHRAVIATGTGWMDAEPEIEAIAPQVYVVNEDGDRPEKRDFCRAHGLDYVVLQRRPHRDLPRRTSTELRGY